MVAIILIASVSVFAQDNGTSAEWKEFYSKKKGYKDISGTDNTASTDVVGIQNKKPVNVQTNNQIYNIVGYYGMNKVIGFDITYGRDIMYGIGLSMFMGKSGVGEVHDTFGPNAFREDIYEINTVKNISLYGIIGYKPIKELIVQGKLGYGEDRKYFNAYDEYQILSPNGYYYTSQSAGGSILLGGSIQYVIDNISPYVGYDNYNGLKIGVGYNF